MSAILERAQNPSKSSPGAHFFRDKKSSRNLIDFIIKNDLKIDPKNLAQSRKSTLGDLLGTPWGPPGVPGAEIDHFGGRFGSIFDPQSIKFAQNRRIKRPRT